MSTKKTNSKKYMVDSFLKRKELRLEEWPYVAFTEEKLKIYSIDSVLT